jgi:hypothetical protein
MTTAFEILSDIRNVETIAAGGGVYIDAIYTALTARAVGGK